MRARRPPGEDAQLPEAPKVSGKYVGSTGFTLLYFFSRLIAATLLCCLFAPVGAGTWTSGVTSKSRFPVRGATCHVTPPSKLLMRPLSLASGGQTGHFFHTIQIHTIEVADRLVLLLFRQVRRHILIGSVDGAGGCDALVMHKNESLAI